jgi:hypothetical protein
MTGLERTLRNAAYFLLGVLLAGLVLLPYSAKADHDYRHSVASTTHKMHQPGMSCSAVMIAPELALTAGHCMGMTSPVLTIGGVDYPITEGYLNPELDLAALIVPGAPCPCATIRGSAAEEGEQITVVGYPYGVGRVVTYGEVQGRVTIEGREYVMTTAAGLPGNSGGGVFDINGYLVGITSLGASSGTMLFYVEIIAVYIK